VTSSQAQLNVSVQATYLSAERLWPIEQPIAGNIQVSSNLTVQSVTEESGKLKISFVFTTSYTPAIAVITIKGVAYVSGSQELLKDIYKGYLEKKPLPSLIIQAISNYSFVEATVLSRSINIPPPVPLPSFQPTAEPKREKPSYIA